MEELPAFTSFYQLLPAFTSFYQPITGFVFTTIFKTRGCRGNSRERMQFMFFNFHQQLLVMFHSRTIKLGGAGGDREKKTLIFEHYHQPFHFSLPCFTFTIKYCSSFRKLYKKILPIGTQWGGNFISQ